MLGQLRTRRERFNSPQANVCITDSGMIQIGLWSHAAIESLCVSNFIIEASCPIANELLPIHYLVASWCL
ncbi:MAG: hypothetical protein H7Z11_03390 [Verrucomicrobia bacterium]|nr:hypothetical protein [Leptolyngbya sp. ES-bin-22]